MSKKVFYSEYGENNGYNVIKKKFGRGFKVTKYGKKITKENGLDIAKTDDDEFIILHNNLDGKGTKEIAFYGTFNKYLEEPLPFSNNNTTRPLSIKSNSSDVSAVLQRQPGASTFKTKKRDLPKSGVPVQERSRLNPFGKKTTKTDHRKTQMTPSLQNKASSMFGNKTKKTKKPIPPIPPKASFKKISKRSSRKSSRRSRRKSKKSRRRSSKRSLRKR